MPRTAATTAPNPRDDPAAAAREAGLRHTSDDRPGITRRRAGKGFAYRDPDGRPIRDERTLARIKALVIPPAYTDVWISTDPRGHLQATGRDARGRKQYRYHPRWQALRDETKFDRMAAFGRALPQIRARTDRDLRLHGLPREKVLAAVVQLLGKTLIRVGNEEYARENGSYGLTTMRDKHVRVGAAGLRFAFRGKGGIAHEVTLRDRRLAGVVKRCRDLPGYELFQYLDDDGRRQTIDSADVNDYLREIAGEAFTAKDFRTWAGTVLCAVTLGACAPCDSPSEAQKNVAAAVKRVSARLGNTPAVCRKSYIHPVVLDAYLDGSLLRTLHELADEELPGLHPAEARLLAVLRRKAAAAPGP